MRTTFLFFALLIGVLTLSFNLSAVPNKAPSSDIIDIEGSWGKSGPRSITPLPPSAFLTGNTVYLLSPSQLSYLTVKIMDLSGDMLFEDVITLNSNSSYPIPVSLPAGEYILILSHSYGTLSGTFKIK